MATVLLRPAPSPPASPAPAKAPAGRDTFVDAVRAVGTAAVVTLHWLMADATWDGRSLHMGELPAIHRRAAEGQVHGKVVVVPPAG